ncbi:MAG: hypothetical protein AAGC97_16205 [Planctomycetota bacterium]
MNWRRAGLVGLLAIGIIAGGLARVRGQRLSRFDRMIAHENPAAAEAALRDADGWTWSVARKKFNAARLARLNDQNDIAHDALVWAENLGFDPERVAQERWLLKIQVESDPRLASAVAASVIQNADRIRETGTSDSPGKRFTLGGRVIGADAIDLGIEILADQEAFGLVRQVLPIWEKLFPDDPRVYNHWSRLPENSEDLLASAGLLRQGHLINPNHLPTCLGLAEANFALSRFERSEAYFRRVVELLQPYVRIDDAGRSGAWELLNAKARLIELLALQNRIDEAVSACKEFLQVLPKHFSVHFQLAKLSLHEAKFQAVLDQLEPMLDIYPDDISLNYFAATAHAEIASESGDRSHAESAQIHADRYLEGRRQLDRLAQLQRDFESGEIRQARDRYTAALDLARTYLAIKWDQAGPWFQEAIQINPRSAVAFAGLVEFHQKSGNLERAKEFQQYVEALR